MCGLRAKRGVSDVRSENSVFPRAYGAFQRIIETRRTAGRFSERTGVSRINKSRAFRGDVIPFSLWGIVRRERAGMMRFKRTAAGVFPTFRLKPMLRRAIILPITRPRARLRMTIFSSVIR